MTWTTISKLGGFPLGVLQVFAPIRMGDVPDCSQSHRSLRCPPSACPPEEGSRIRGTVRPEAGQHLDIRLCLAVPCRKCLFLAVVCRAPRSHWYARPQATVGEAGERGREWKFIGR
jgi:hypothetical protein